MAFTCDFVLFVARDFLFFGARVQKSLHCRLHFLSRLRIFNYAFAGLAQLVARNLAKVEVAGSNPVARSIDFNGRIYSAFFIRRDGQVVRQRPAKPLSPVRIRVSPPL